MNDVLRRQWHDLLSGWAVDASLVARTFEEVRAHYAGSGRFYHTLDHVQNVLQSVESLGSYTRHRNAVKLAAWLHDVIYDSRASDNEERSADYAERLFSLCSSEIVASKGRGSPLVSVWSFEQGWRFAAKGTVRRYDRVPIRLRST